MAAIPIGFERWEPGGLWGDVVYDDGQKTSVPDPDGSIEAQARSYGARFNAQPKAAPDPSPQPSLTGAAAPPPQPSTPSPAVPAPPPPGDRGPPPGAAAPAPTAPAVPSAAPATPGGATAAPAMPGAPPSMPSTNQSPAARAVASQGIDPRTLQVAPTSTEPRPPQTGASPALSAVQQHAPQLLPTSAEVTSEGPDAASADAVRSASDVSLGLRGQAVSEDELAKRQNLFDQSRQANVDYFTGWRQQQVAQGQEAAAQKARDNAAAALSQAKQQKLDDHPDFPEWFVATSILGAIAGGFNAGFTGGAYKSTTVPMLHQLVTDWANNQRYNKSQLLSSLEDQLGDKNAALAAAKAGLHDSLANMADAHARYARTVEATRELSAASKASRATSLDEWSKAQTLVMGKDSAKTSMGFGINNEVTQQLAGMGITPQVYSAGLEKKVGAGENGESLNQAIDTVLQIDADRSTLASLAAANDKTLPGKGVLKIPDALVPLASKLGIRQGMQAEQVRQIYQQYLVQNAKAMGSRINPQELEISGETLGATTQAFLRTLDRLRNEKNEAIKSTAEDAWPGWGTQVLDLHRRATAAIRGIPAPAVDPFEVQNGPALHETSEAQQRADADSAAQKRRASLQHDYGKVGRAIDRALHPAPDPTDAPAGAAPGVPF